jgi:hypothetical protein
VICLDLALQHGTWGFVGAEGTCARECLTFCRCYPLQCRRYILNGPDELRPPELVKRPDKRQGLVDAHNAALAGKTKEKPKFEWCVHRLLHQSTACCCMCLIFAGV